MSGVDWLQILVPSVVMVIAAVLGHIAARRADTLQKERIEVEIRKIEDELRSECVVELHRQKIAAYLAVLDAVGKISHFLWSSSDRGSNSFTERFSPLLERFLAHAYRGMPFFSQHFTRKFTDFTKALFEWQATSFVAGEEEGKYDQGQNALVTSVRKDLGMEDLPDHLFPSLFSALDA